MAQVDSENSTAARAEGGGSLYRPIGISPEDFFQALGRVRRAARNEIERLIEWLDSTIDCDEDAAVDDGPCDDDPDSEPSLGSFDRMSDQIKAWDNRHMGDVDCEVDRADHEPALAAPELHPMESQEQWAAGNSDDREGDGCADDREGDELQHGGEAVHEDDEPSLGWTDEEAITGRTYAGAMGQQADLEEGDAPRSPQNRAPRAPSPQERADDLLMRWRLARAAGVPAAKRLDQEDRA